MKRTGVVAVLVFASFLLFPGAFAHGPGGVSTHLEGSLSLAPSGATGDIALLALSDLGEVEAGEEFRYFWEANAGQGPPVRFAILQELPGSTPEAVHGMTAATVTETWMIPAHAEYTASWENPTNEVVTVSYLFEVLAPVASPGLVDWPLYLGLGVAGVVLAFLFFWSGRGKRGTEPPEGGPEVGDETDPGDR